MTATTKRTAVPPAAGRPRPLFIRRADVDALKVLATVLVILCLTGVPGFGGAFIGYDVFFVIVGFLTIRRLYTEVMDERDLDLRRFLRVRYSRLWPSLAIVTAVTLILSIPILSRYVLREAAIQGGAALVFLSDLVIARLPGGFFGGDVRDSPMLATWSVSVVGQFLLLAGFIYVLFIPLIDASSGRSRSIVRPVTMFGSAVVLVLSMGVAGYLTANARQWAFFTLGGRLWEFAVGAVLALVALPTPLRGRTFRLLASVAGLLIIAGAAVLARNSTSYPFPWAVLPVLGISLLLMAGDERKGGASPFEDALDRLPLKSATRYSYLVYLTFYPGVVFAVALLKSDGLPARLAGLLAALLLSGAVWWALHRRRAAERVQRASRRRMVVGAVGVVVVALVAAGVGIAIGEPPDAYALVRGQVDSAKAAPTYECGTEATSDGGVRYCRSGQTESEVNVLFVGDSRVKMWKSTMTEVASAMGVQLIERHLDNCPATDVRVDDDAAKAQECADFRRDTMQLVRDLKPKAVVIAQREDYIEAIKNPDGSMLGRPERKTLWGDKSTALFQDMSKADARPIVIEEAPVPTTDPMQCMLENKAVTPCRFSEKDGQLPIRDLQAAEAIARKNYGNVPALIPSTDICIEDTCSIENEGVLVYGSKDNLSTRFMAAQKRKLQVLLTKVGV